MEYSMYKTFAAKYKSTVVKICKKYKKDKVFTVYYKNNKGKTLMRQFYHDGFKRKNKIMRNVTTECQQAIIVHQQALWLA